MWSIFRKINVFYFRYVKLLVFRILNLLIIRRESVTLGKKSNIRGLIHISNSGTISIGDNFKVNSGQRYNPIGGDSIFQLICHKGGELLIGQNVGISNSTIVCTKAVSIADNVCIGGGCKIWDTNFHSLNKDVRHTALDCGDNVAKADVFIDSNVFIGANCIILKGVHIGENSIVAAGSVVTKSIPSNQIWGGNPAKFLRNNMH